MQKKDACVICLSDVGDIQSSHTHLACKCNVPVHTHCWMQYVQTKNGMLECPMCHVITLRNPILPASITGMPKEIPVSIEEGQKQNQECMKRCAVGCLCWWITSIAVGAIFG
jgi:hypothetical protein